MVRVRHPYFQCILIKTGDRIDINIYPKDIRLTQNIIDGPHFISSKYSCMRLGFL